MASPKNRIALPGSRNDWGPHDMLVIGAFRYYLSRRSYAEEFVDWLLPRWNRLEGKTQHLIHKEVEEALAGDVQIGVPGYSSRPIGHVCDRKSWLQVQALWAIGGAIRELARAGAGTQVQRVAGENRAHFGEDGIGLFGV